jgi:lysophospholipase L1-like esterase
MSGIAAAAMIGGYFAAVALSLAPVAAADPLAGGHASAGVVEDPCAALDPPPAIVLAYRLQMAQAQSLHQAPPAPQPAESDAYAEWQKKLLLGDFSGLCRYQAANAALPPASDHRVVFFGDSITELWAFSSPELFRGDVIDRGISGQTTAQMLGRFRADVIDLHPKIVHILAGTNDIAGNTGPTTLTRIEANIATMVELARVHDITVILGSVPPAVQFPWRPEIKPAAAIFAYNRWLRNFAYRQHIRFCDYHAVLANGSGGPDGALSDDGVHPNTAGFRLMTPIAARAIDAVLRKTVARGR